ncbi:MAG: hypothetical protein MI924_00265 [Chloroflexales bacterium]|nr:hypothetical protein [Chloroflexales bacterium]
MENNDDPIVPIPVSRAARSAIVRQAAEGRSVWSGKRIENLFKRIEAAYEQTRRDRKKRNTAMPTIINSDYLQAVVSRANELQRNDWRLSPADAIDQALTERQVAQEAQARHDAQVAAFTANAAAWRERCATLPPDERQAAEQRAAHGATCLKKRR